MQASTRYHHQIVLQQDQTQQLPLFQLLLPILLDAHLDADALITHKSARLPTKPFLNAESHVQEDTTACVKTALFHLTTFKIHRKENVPCAAPSQPCTALDANASYALTKSVRRKSLNPTIVPHL